MMTSNRHTKPMESHALLSRLMEGNVLSETEVTHLLEDKGVPLKEAADEVRQRQVGDTVPYQVRASLYLTNLCEMQPSLYHYPRQPGADGTRTLTVDDVEATLELARIRGAASVFIHGGFWGDLQLPGLEAPSLLRTYGKLLGYICDRYPDLAIEGFSPDEIEYLAIISGRSHRYLLEFLKDRGLKTLFGHGAEVLVDSVRHKICPKKTPVRDWLAIATLAAELKLSLTLTMEYGPVEQAIDRIRHLIHIRSLAEKHPHTIKRFIPQPVPAMAVQAGASISTPPVAERLRILALCRLLLGEHIPQIQTSWLPGGEEEAQEGLLWGASHFGSTDANAYINFLSGASQTGQLSGRELESLIQETGRVPQKS